MAQAEAPKIIFSMIGVSKKIERKVILNDISLSFYYGAKIGVLGLNGSGKSSLMRILAGVDKEIDGRVHFEPGYPVGFLPQEPVLTAGATVRACVEEGVKHLTDLTAAYDASWDELSAAEDDKARDAISAKQAELQEKIDHLGASFGRRTPPRGAGTAAPAEAFDSPPRRTDEPSRCRQRELAGAAPQPL